MTVSSDWALLQSVSFASKRIEATGSPDMSGNGQELVVDRMVAQRPSQSVGKDTLHANLPGIALPERCRARAPWGETRESATSALTAGSTQERSAISDQPGLRPCEPRRLPEVGGGGALEVPREKLTADS